MTLDPLEVVTRCPRMPIQLVPIRLRRIRQRMRDIRTLIAEQGTDTVAKEVFGAQ